jgi:hypothetical protein
MPPRREQPQQAANNAEGATTPLAGNAAGALANADVARGQPEADEPPRWAANLVVMLADAIRGDVRQPAPAAVPAGRPEPRTPVERDDEGGDAGGFAPVGPAMLRAASRCRRTAGELLQFRAGLGLGFFFQQQYISAYHETSIGD